LDLINFPLEEPSHRGALDVIPFFSRVLISTQPAMII